MWFVIPEHVQEITIGDRESADIEKIFDDFLKRMENVDKKLSIQTQKIVLKGSTQQAVRSLRQRTRRAFKKHTGYARRSVKQVTKESQTLKGVAYTTFGWRDKGLPDIESTTLRKGYSDWYRIKPKPATYIGIWNDLGTGKRNKLRARHILRDEWQSHKAEIINNLEKALIEIIDKGLVNK